MRQPAFAKAQRGRRISEDYTLPAPTGGWNTRDNISMMGEEFAIEVDNWFGTTSDVAVREGMVDHVTGIVNQVESLMPYNSANGTQTLFAAAGEEFYDVTTAGTVGAAVQTGLSNARWQSVNFTITGGTSFLCAFNGTDSPRYFNGSTWITITGASSPAIVGVTPSDIISATVFKRRMYLVENNSLTLYYLPIDSVGGTVQKTRLDGYFNKGGTIVQCGTWTIDGGEGLDDRLVVISSEGQLAVFQGTNPSSVATWGLIGVWNIGQPVSRRCMVKKGGDLLVLTTDGLVPLSSALISAQGNNSLDEKELLSYLINDAMRDATTLYKTNFGWGLAYDPEGNQLIMNVPVVEGSQQQQYVMNTTKNSWWRYTGLEANCWEVFDDRLYFGGSGVVCKFGQVFDDSGDQIGASIKQAFSYLGSRGRKKVMNAVRPNLLANGQPGVSMSFAVDYGESPPDTPLSFAAPVFAVWDTAIWDGGVWGGGLVPFSEWQTVGAVGTAVALRMKTATNGIELRYASADLVFEYGGPIT